MALTPVLRVARPTTRLAEIAALYRQGLGLAVLGEFEDHDGFSGVILGHPRVPYHLEFTHSELHPPGPPPSAEHLLIFYLPDREEWSATSQRMAAAGFRTVPSVNPYWDRWGRTFEDPDGYRVVLAQRAWTT